MTTTTSPVIPVHELRWWCPGDRAWMSATLHQDVENEQYVQCINCGSVLRRVKGAA